MTNNNSNRSRSKAKGSKKRGAPKKSGRNTKKKFDPVAFWGDPTAEQELPDLPIDTPDPSAAVASLGHPPLPGQGAASQQYFKAVYERASLLAGALALAGGLDELPDEGAEADQLDEAE